MIRRGMTPRAMFLGLLFGIVASASSWGDVRVCNKGNVELKVLRLKIFAFQTLRSWDIRGWTSISPDRCEDISYDDGYTHIAFAVDGPKNQIGVVQYEFTDSSPSSSARIKEICAPPKDIDDSG